MANAISYAEKFVPVIDSIYKKASLTAGLDAATKLDFTGTNTVKVLKVTTSGLGDYDRNTGYPKGDVNVGWEAMTLSEERGKEMSIDRMDDEETLGQAFGLAMSEFIRLHVAPEVDAFRFAKYASTAGIGSASADMASGADILAAIDLASAAMDEAEVPDGRRLYVSSALKPLLNAALSRTWASESGVNRVLNSYNDMPIIYVPQSRFYSGITLNDGTSAWGYAKNGVNLNFMMVCPQSVLQATKMALPKVFTPDENQEKDAWKFQYRLYHDAMAYENKVSGIYVHKATK